jgi:hypothetical protein
MNHFLLKKIPAYFMLLVAGILITEKTDCQINLGWAKNIGTAQDEYGQNIVKDLAGNICIGSQSSVPTDADPSPTNTAMISGSFLAKYDTDGNFLKVFNLPGTKWVMDSNGNYFVAGYFTGTLNFDFISHSPAAILSTLTPAAYELFIAKYDADGKFLWVKKFNTTYTKEQSYAISIEDITIDRFNNFYILGSLYYAQTIDFNPDPIAQANITTKGPPSISTFFARYNAAGDFNWVNKIEGENDGLNGLLKIKTNGTGNVFVTGYFDGANINLDSRGNNASAVLQNDGYGNGYCGYSYLAKYDAANGDYLFGFKIGTAGKTTIFNGFAIDSSSNNIYVNTRAKAGIAINYNPLFGSTELAVPNGGTVMAKYATTGNLLWTKVLENQTSGSGYDGLSAASMEINANGIIYLCGSILGHIGVDMDPGVNNFIIQNNFTYYINGYDAGGGTAYIAKYNASGAFISAARIISNANTAVTKLCFDNNDNIYCTGYMYDKPDFDPSAETFNLTSAGNSDIFFAKYTTAVAGPLPISLVSFTGQTISEKHLLKWTTATEQNNKGFELQQSADGYSFQPIGWMASLAPSGNSDNRLSYTYSNVGLLPGTNFYRLKQIDKDGKYLLSPIVLLDNKRKSVWAVSIYPNPVVELANVVVNTSIAQAIQFSLFSAEGKIIWANKQTLQAGKQSIVIPMKTLPSGTYRLIVQGIERSSLTIIKK